MSTIPTWERVVKVLSTISDDTVTVPMLTKLTGVYDKKSIENAAHQITLALPEWRYIAPYRRAALPGYFTRTEPKKKRT